MSAESQFPELQAPFIGPSVEGDPLECCAPIDQLTGGPEHGGRALSIPRRSALDGPPPLSFAQERLWFLQNLDPETTAYNITAIHRMDEPIDPAQLEHAVHSVVDRHDVLRTSFPDLDGSPTLQLNKDLYPTLAFHDLSQMDEGGQVAVFDAVVRHLSQKKFNLASGPLLELALIRFSQADHRIVLVIHDILCDARSTGIFFSELEYFYEMVHDDRNVQPMPPAIQYGDYAQWERDQYSSRAMLPQIEYWKAKLSGAPPYLDLPLDSPRSPSLVYEGKVHRFELSASTAESVKRFAGQEGVSLFVALLGIFQAVLSRYTKQADIVVGAVAQTQTEFAPMIGCMTNMHVLRTKIPAEATARDLLALVRTSVLEAEHAVLPLEILMSELVTERNLSRSPLIQTAFVLHNAPPSSDYEAASGGTTLALRLSMQQSNDGIGGCIEYNGALFRPETMACFAECYETLAAGMAGSPELPIRELPALSAAQEAAWFDSCNGPTADIPALCTHEWMDRQARETPHAIAVVCGEEQLTYRQLEERSNRLAHRLRGMGVGRGSLVALCLNRTVDLLIAPLAVWKAGAAYLPLDPEFPANRLAFMIEDSAAAVLITESGLLEKLPADLPELICLDRDRQSIERESDRAVDSATEPDDLAYVIYTSGSTGKPKGVEIVHRALVNLLASMQHEPGIDAADRWLAITTFSFDMVGPELYLPLVTGARVVLAPREATFDGMALSALLRESGATILQATPITWRLLLESGWRSASGLKILCGGEALTPDLAEQLLATGAEVWNLYGPTETTVWSTLERVTDHNRISIGHPIANTQVLVLDDFRRPVPLGVPGELYIGGAGLARGYLRREQLTAERFIHSAFHGGKRLYKTGDLVRRMPGGNLECRGRADHQVKVRGFRIELGEIETALEQQPAISQAVVIVREDVPGIQQLTAYLKASGQLEMEPGDLRRALSASLPEYMIPSAFVQVESFPLTPTRKVDRKALLSPEYRPRNNFDHAIADGASQGMPPASNGSGRNGYVAPGNNVQLAMAEIWQDVLGISRVGIHDNFFELGGHSLPAARLISRLRSTMDVELPLRCIFIHPTIAELSNHVAYDISAHRYRYTSELPRWRSLVPVQPRGTRTPLFLVAGYANPDETLLELSQLIPHFGIDQPLFGFRPRWIEGNDGYATVEEMAREFLAELRAVQPCGPYQLGGHCVGGIAALEMAQLLLQEGEEVKLVVLLDTERPTAWRAFLSDVHNMRLRSRHMAEVLSDIIFARGGTRGHLIRKLVHRKLRETDHFYKAKVDYQRMLYNHAPQGYAGRISLIVNQDEARLQRDLGWKGFAREGLDVYIVPGAHYTVMDLHAREVAEAILKSMEKVSVSIDSESVDRVEAGVQ